MVKRLGLISRQIYGDFSHALDSLPPDLLLPKVIQPYRFVATLAGILPMKLSPYGKASYKLISWASLYTVVVNLMFITDSCFLIPMYIFLVQISNSSGEESQSQVQVTHVAQMMFVSCQYLGAAVCFLITPWNTPAFVNYWNKIQQLVTKVVVRNSLSNREFLGIYLEARWNIRIWIITSISFSLFCVYSYGSGFDLYMGKNTHPVLYWSMYFGFCWFPYLLSFHILHSVIFCAMCCVLRSCFISLKNFSESLSHDQFGDATKLYREINELILETGRVGGIYVAIEVLVMTICVTMNAFFLVSKFEGMVGLKETLIYAAMIIPYCIWFHWLCTVGESLVNEGILCCAAVKRLASRDPQNPEWALIEPPVVVTAKGYFAIRMGLFTTVMGTIATYLIVLLQFKFGSLDIGKSCPVVKLMSLTNSSSY